MGGPTDVASRFPISRLYDSAVPGHFCTGSKLKTRRAYFDFFGVLVGSPPNTSAGFTSCFIISSSPTNRS